MSQIIFRVSVRLGGEITLPIKSSIANVLRFSSRKPPLAGLIAGGADGDGRLIGLPQHLQGFTQGLNGLPQQLQGFPQDLNGLPQTFNGFTQVRNGVTQALRGFT